ncbi:MAG: hypothetical protein ABSG93_09440 [Solirubrobacteraceae bacterium]
MTIRSARLPALFAAALVLAGAPVLAMAAGSVRDGRYSGSVGPGYPISFQVEADGTVVKNLDVSIEATCQPGAGDVAPVYHFGEVRIERDKFSGSTSRQFGTTVSDAVHISASLSDGKATGEVSDRANIKSLPSCTQSEPFTAKLK